MSVSRSVNVFCRTSDRVRAIQKSTHFPVSSDLRRSSHNAISVVAFAEATRRTWYVCNSSARIAREGGSVKIRLLWEGDTKKEVINRYGICGEMRRRSSSVGKKN